jgi:anti-sigma factor RsiW
MGERVLRFAAPGHRAVDALLPWFVNGTLDGAELVLVEAHLRECPRCQREVAWLREFQTAYAGADSAPDAAESFRKLSQQLDAPGPTPGRWWRLRRAWSNLGERLLPWAPWAVAAQLVVIALLGGLLWSGDRPPGPYRTLGASETGGPPAGNLIVVFDPASSEAQLRRVLNAIGARLVDGPSEAGAYVLAVPPERAALARKALGAERSVVLVRQLGAGGAVE